ncbi:hypothetical protein Q1695_012978 [Nippostrongylus brasiliensis]|nr:hypothetical protein Q1695_012978 [Nippostrongylus brasiliensis]
MVRLAAVLLLSSLCLAEALQEQPLHLRLKRQDCRCVRNPRQTGGVSCSCAQNANGSYTLSDEIDVAQELTNTIQGYPQGQARCGCLQIVYLGTAQYQCQCADNGGNTLPITTTTLAPIITTEATTTTTMPPATLPPATLPPVTQAPQYPTVPTVTDGPGQCQCVMISITSPASAQYQCNCNNAPQANPTLATETLPTPAPEVIETLAPVTYPPTTIAPTVAPVYQTAAPQQQQPASQYPLTTTCVMYVGIPTTSCTCLPQYDPCAQNICCLKAKFRSHKNVAAVQQPQHDSAEHSTVDVLMNILQKIKTKLNA